MLQRHQVEHWFQEHPGLVHGDVHELMARCEPSIRRHAREDAWMAAKRYVEQKEHDWDEASGAHASEVYVAADVCSRIARELAHHEPEPHEGDEDHLAGGLVKAELEPEGWAYLARWVLDVAREEEHKTWQEIVRFTHTRARSLVEEHHLSSDTRFDHTHCYGQVARRIAAMLERDYSLHAFPR